VDSRVEGASAPGKAVARGLVLVQYTRWHGPGAVFPLRFLEFLKLFNPPVPAWPWFFTTLNPIAERV